jgi:hypothetical protein
MKTIHTPNKLSQQYNLQKTILIAESGKAGALPASDRNRMRIILHNNIESHTYYSRNVNLSIELRKTHIERASELKKYLNKIPNHNIKTAK